MTTLNFPTNPTIGTTYSAPNGIIYVYDGTKWNVQGTTITSAESINFVQDSVAPLFENIQGSGISFSYDADTNVLTANVTGGGGGWDGTTISNNLIPDTDVAYDLGSPTAKFRDLYLSTNTLYLGESSVSIDDAGKLVVAQPILAGEGIGGISFIKWTANSEVLIRTETSSPFAARFESLKINDQLELLTGYPSPTGVTLTVTGIVTKTIDNSGDYYDFVIPVDLPAGGDTFIYTFNITRPSVTDVSQLTDTQGLLGSGGPANLGNFKIENEFMGTVDSPNTGGWGAYNMWFSPNGEGQAWIQIPNDQNINDNGTSLELGNWGSGGIRVATGRGAVLLGADMEAPGAPSHFHIAFEGSNNGTPNGDLILGDDFNYVRIAAYANGVQIGTNPRDGQGSQKYWSFDQEGNLTVPNDIYTTENNDLNIKVFNATYVPDAGASFNVQTRRNDTGVKMSQFVVGSENIVLTTDFNGDISGSSHEWTFDKNGRLTLPAGGDITDINGTSVLGGNANLGNYQFNGDTLLAPDAGVIQQNYTYTKSTYYTAPDQMPQVIWTASEWWIGTAKLILQVEVSIDNSSWHTQSCEALISSRVFQQNAEPVMTVYGVVHTSDQPLVTFTVRRNGSGYIELIGTPELGTTNVPNYHIYSVELATAD